MSQEKVRLSKSCIGPLEKKAVLEVLDREYLGMGQMVGEFEENLSSYFGRPAVCVVNGTAALHLSLQSVGITTGDEVLVPSITYVASYQAITATGATPISCDIDEHRLCMDVNDAEKRITKRTKAIMPVHFAGGFGNISDYYELASKNNLRVIEDAAHAFGSKYDGKLIGSFGDIACFSFDGIKNITSGEGGCIITEDPKVLNKVRDARLLGVENDTEARFKGKRTWSVTVSEQGWRYHMSDLMASIGIVQLRRRKEFYIKRQNLASRYNLNFENQPRIHPVIKDLQSIVPHIYVIRIDNLLDRASLRKEFLKHNIETGIHYPPNHSLQYFKSAANPPLSNTEKYQESILSLPLHPDLSYDEVDYVSDLLIGFLEKF